MTNPITIKLQGIDKVQKKFNTFQMRMKSSGPAYQAIGNIGRRDVIEHFERTEGPKGNWKPLKKSRKDGSSKPLNDTGQNLKGRINYKAGNDNAYVFIKQVFAAVHNFGGRAGKKRAAVIPQRQFMWISKDAIKTMIKALAHYIINGKS